MSSSLTTAKAPLTLYCSLFHTSKATCTCHESRSIRVIQPYSTSSTSTFVATIVRFEANTIHLTDGTVIVGVDTVIFVTGFFYTYPILSHVRPQPNGPEGHRVPGLYQHIFDLLNLNTIASVGVPNVSLTWMAWEKAAFLIAFH
ncbi:Putative FAD/NAD(P)-binding domain superfamily [Colletotrichum destructivum]|uniref:FAD/NAD(P)-binding domain superfamily n=1 Tax=Colletotrichum destructivum TaxID=34406 RepID=A0AAX4ITD0_9PEZI|nr:Putative FAD/NAD(P)-binding domain superfamily [Colletotrichum destructivum]